MIRPRFKARIEWEEDNKTIMLINDGSQAWKLLDGETANTKQDSNQARNSTFGSHYVFCMPFKLADPGTHLSYLGQAQHADGTLVDKVEATYEPGMSDAGGLHTWIYYFDAEDGRLRANHLQYDSDKYSFTEYLDFKNIDGWYMPTRRYGYQSNSQAEKVSRVSEISYEEIKINAHLEKSPFGPAS